MELELNTTRLNCYDPVLDTTIFQEETLESIVPDACPDILRIVDTEAAAFLKSKEAQEGRAEATGTIRCTVLYEPDGAEGLRRLTVNIPFTCAAEAAGVRSGCRMVAVPRVQGADARSLNPRKVLARVGLAVELQVFAPQTAEYHSGAICGEEAGVEQLGETQPACLITAVEEKPFTFSDDITLSGSKPAVSEILRTDTELLCGESKIIGNKLIFKGEADFQLLYRDGAGEIHTSVFELPFSQIMEVSGVGEEADLVLRVLTTGCECIPDGEESRTLSLSMNLFAPAVVREERQIELLSDAYSTVYGLTTERSAYTFYRLLEHSQRRVTVRELLETMSPVREVCDVSLGIGPLSQRREGGQIVVTVDTEVSVLHRNESGEMAAVRKTIPASCTIDVPEGALCFCRCDCAGERFASPAGDGAEVRYPLDFHLMLLEPAHTSGVTGIRLHENEPRNTGTQPSIILRAVGPGERLWDIAKAYGTTIGDIVQANALPDEALPMGQMLLIPKKR